METLYQKVMGMDKFACLKHDLHHCADEYAASQFNKLTASEQLEKISEALEELLLERNKGATP